MQVVDCYKCRAPAEGHGTSIKLKPQGRSLPVGTQIIHCTSFFYSSDQLCMFPFRHTALHVVLSRLQHAVEKTALKIQIEQSLCHVVQVFALFAHPLRFLESLSEFFFSWFPHRCSPLAG